MALRNRELLARNDDDDIRFRFSFLKKNSDSVRNEFGSVPFKKTRFGSDIIVIYYSCDSKYYSDSG